MDNVSIRIQHELKHSFNQMHRFTSFQTRLSKYIQRGSTRLSKYNQRASSRFSKYSQRQSTRVFASQRYTDMFRIGSIRGLSTATTIGGKGHVS